jgi:hypothetical protein
LDWRWRYRSAPCSTWDNSWQCEQKNSWSQSPWWWWGW